VGGGNSYKHLGVGYTYGSYDTPVQVTELTNVVAIAGSGDNTYALKGDGTVWSWGWNIRGELGNGTTGKDEDCITKEGVGDKGPNCASGLPVQVKDLQHVKQIANRLAVTEDGSVYQWGERGFPRQDNAPVKVPGIDNAVAVAAGGANYVLRADKTVWAWGVGYNGRLGNGSESQPYVDSPAPVQGLHDVTAIGSSITAGYAVTSDGAEYAWGGGQDGLLGDGKYFSKSLVPVRVPNVSGATALGSNGYAIVGG
jgi:alpha-tubulin suppressor-like RCC1 family protein